MGCDSGCVIKGRCAQFLLVLGRRGKESLIFFQVNVYSQKE